MGRRKGSLNKKTLEKMGLTQQPNNNTVVSQDSKTFGYGEQPKKKRGRPPKVTVDLFSANKITFKQEEMIEQEERLEKVEELNQEQDELAAIEYITEVAAKKIKRPEVEPTKIERIKVRFQLGEDWIEGHHCGISSDPKTKGLHIIKSMKPNILSFLPKSSFEYV
jgi:hypothetical protein